MINIYLSSQIYIKANDIPLELRKELKEAYTFNWWEYRGRDKVQKTMTLLNTKKHSNNFWICLPQNLDYLIPLLDKYNTDYIVIDNRSKVTLENPPIFNKRLRDNQEEAIKMMKHHKFNCVLALPTSFGKTFVSSYLSTYLKTTVLFIASKSSYIESFKKEVRNNIENWQDNFIEINSEWLKNPIIKPIMTCSIQILYRDEITEALKNKVGCAVFDEIHNTILGGTYINGVNNINPKYRVFLSGTPQTKAVGFVEASCSSNIVTLDSENLDFKIKYQPISISLLHLVSEYKATDMFHEKKKIIFSQSEFISSLTNFISRIVELDRNILLFCTDKTFQENMSAILNACGIESVCLNSNTKKKDIEKILADYEEGKIKVLVSGASSVEALSLYRLSVFVDVDLSDSENTIVQKLGRLKRRKQEVSDKSKIYIKFLYKSMTDSKFNYVIKPVVTNKKLSQYTDLQPTLYTNGLMFEEIFEEIFCEEIE